MIPVLSQITPVHYPSYLRSSLILSSKLLLVLPSGLFSSVISTKILHVYAFLLDPMRSTCPAHLLPFMFSCICNLALSYNQICLILNFNFKRTWWERVFLNKIEISKEWGRAGASFIGGEVFMKEKEIINFKLLFFININIWIDFFSGILKNYELHL